MSIEEYFDRMASEIILTERPGWHGLVLTEECKQAVASAMLDAFVVGNGYIQRGLGGPIQRLDPTRIRVVTV